MASGSPRRRELESLLHARLRPLVVAEPVSEESGSEECLQTRLRLILVRGESLLAAAASFTQVTAHIPEAHQRPDEPELVVAASRAQRVEGEAEVVVFGVSRSSHGACCGPVRWGSASCARRRK